MSYLVLARKYRPRDFDSLVGQPHVVQALANALTQQRLHHAYLFTGTRGVGKTTISRILAKSLNCTGADGIGGITAHPCGVCPACRDIDSGRYIDYVELDAASNRGVDEISQLLDQAVYKPVVGRFKVYMIDEVHMLSNHAFNAMLKSLEEPPEYLKFVLATTDPQKVPPTVLSRCLQFNLRPLAPQTVEEHLADVLGQEGIPSEPAALRLIARAARGSMRDGLSLADQAIAHGGGSIEEVGVRQMLGAVDRSHAVRLVEALAARDGAATITAIDQLRELGLSAAGTLEEMATLLQQMAVLQVVPQAVDPSDPDAPSRVRLAGLLQPDETQLLYSIALQGRAELGLAPDEYSGLVMVLLRFLAFPPGDRMPVSDGARGVSSAAPRAPAAPAIASFDSTPATPTQPARDVAEQPQQAIVQLSSPVHEPTRRPPDLRDATAAPAGASASGAPAERSASRSAAAQPVRTAGEPPPWVEAPDEASADEESPTMARGPARASVPMSRTSERASVSVPTAPDARRSAATAVGSASDKDQAHLQAEGMVEASADPGAQACRDRWAASVGRMIEAGTIGAMVRELAMQAECIGIDDVETPVLCRLRVERETLRAPAQCEKLQVALGNLIGRPVRLETECGAARDTPALRDAAEKARRQAEAERTIQNDPLVQALMAQYKTARIVPGSVRSV